MPTRPEVQLDDRGDLLISPLEEWAEATTRGVVDEDIDGPERVLNLLDERGAVLRRVAEIERDGDDVGAERRDVVARLLERPEVRDTRRWSRADRDGGALRGKAHGDRLPDAPACTGHERHSAFTPRPMVPPLRPSGS